MRKNIGVKDSYIRIIVLLMLVFLSIILLSWSLLVIAVYLLITVITRASILYLVIGYNT